MVAFSQQPDLTSLLNVNDYSFSRGAFIHTSPAGSTTTIESYTGKGYLVVSGKITATNVAISEISITINSGSVISLINMPIGSGYGGITTIIPFTTGYTIYGLINNAGDSISIYRMRYIKT